VTTAAEIEFNGYDCAELTGAEKYAIKDDPDLTNAQPVAVVIFGMIQFSLAIFLGFQSSIDVWNGGLNLASRAGKDKPILVSIPPDQNCDHITGKTSIEDQSLCSEVWPHWRPVYPAWRDLNGDSSEKVVDCTGFDTRSATACTFSFQRYSTSGKTCAELNMELQTIAGDSTTEFFLERKIHDNWGMQEGHRSPKRRRNLRYLVRTTY